MAENIASNFSFPVWIKTTLLFVVNVTPNCFSRACRKIVSEDNPSVSSPTANPWEGKNIKKTVNNRTKDLIKAYN